MSSTSDWRQKERERLYGGLLRQDHTLHGAILLGLDGHAIEVQARAVEVLPKPIPISRCFRISGMPTGAISEVQQRLEGTFAKLGFKESEVDVLINLAPADLPKSGTWLDLPIAIILLQAVGVLPDLSEKSEGNLLLLGELGLHAEIRSVPGALSLAFTSKPGQSLIVPEENAKECSLMLFRNEFSNNSVYPVKTFDQVVDFFNGERLATTRSKPIKFEAATEKAIDFGKIKGQERAKRAATIAAAGGHNMLLIGPPGEGKSLIANAIRGILPNLTREEQVELTRIYSATGELEKDGMAITRRPVRNIHHGISESGLVGGGSGIPSPGEITLAHLGILFLDELPEFSRKSLEALRQPMESGTITISRTKASLEFPCSFTLIAAMNPCPCGYYPDMKCNCEDRKVKAYQAKISGPLLDRIDLKVDLKPLSTEERFAKSNENESSKLKSIVETARQRQELRFQGQGIPFNAAIPGGHISDFCRFSKSAWEKFKGVVDENDLSTRNMDRIAKVSQTISDLNDSEEIESDDVDEAASFVLGGSIRNSFK